MTAPSPTPVLRIMQCVVLATLVALITAAAPSPASGQALEERFDGTFPPSGWQIVDNAGDGVEWQRNSTWGDDNWTGGSGYCAEVSSAHSPGLAFNTQLISPTFTVPPEGLLFFRANYQNFMGTDQFGVSVVWGINHLDHLTWESDHGSFESLPGYEALVSIFPPLIGQDVRLVFEYRDHVNARGDAYYIQIDDVIVGDESPVECAGWGAIKALYR